MLKANIIFFAWVQSKLLTADKMAARNWQCNLQRAICDQEAETTVHLCLHCSFAREVWHLVSNWTGGLIKVPKGNIVEHSGC